MKGARNCGYARMEDLGCAVVHATGMHEQWTFICFLSNCTLKTTSLTLGLKMKRRNHSQCFSGLRMDNHEEMERIHGAILCFECESRLKKW